MCGKKGFGQKRQRKKKSEISFQNSRRNGTHFFYFTPCHHWHNLIQYKYLGTEYKRKYEEKKNIKEIQEEMLHKTPTLNL